MDLYRHLTALSEPIRVRILHVLEQDEFTVSELMTVVQLPQSTVSRHLKVLRQGGWIARRAEGSAGWFRRARELSPQARQLWEVVSTQHGLTHQAEEDRTRAQAVFEARRVDSASFFGRMHDQWDGLRHGLFGDGFMLPALLGLLDPALVVADLGCGTGPTLATLAPAVRSVIGVDREQAMLDAARERTRELANVELRLGGLEALPLRDDEVDAAVVLLVLHHVEDLVAALGEMRRVVRPRGRVIIVDMVAHDRRAWRDTMGHKHLGFDPDRLAAMAGDVGLGPARIRPLVPDPEAQGPPLFVAMLGA